MGFRVGAVGLKEWTLTFSFPGMTGDDFYLWYVELLVGATGGRGGGVEWRRLMTGGVQAIRGRRFFRFLQVIDDVIIVMVAVTRVLVVIEEVEPVAKNQ